MTLDEQGDPGREAGGALGAALAVAGGYFDDMS